MQSSNLIVTPEPSVQRAGFSEWLLSHLRRVTTSGRFIPEIDGLRFVAIALVFYFHVYGRVFVNSGGRVDPATPNDLLANIINWGGSGVMLFFVISGFILALPFAEQYLANGRPVSLKAYFKRRLFRLEPPYIICMLLFFIMALAVDRESRSTGVRHLMASLTYSHNLIYGAGNSFNPVTWSLEVEIQFYILAPLLMLFLKIPSAPGRVMAILMATLPSTYLACRPTAIESIWWKLSIIRYLGYFLMGILLADWYMTRLKRPTRSALLWDTIATVMLILVWRLQIRLSSYTNITDAIMPYIIFIGCFGVFRGVTWRRILSNRWLTTIGGMCYTIYLYHKPMLHVLHPLTRKVVLSRIFWVNLTIQSVIITLILLPIFAVLFVLFEKPFMYRDWPARFGKWYRGRNPATAAQIKDVTAVG